MRVRNDGIELAADTVGEGPVVLLVGGAAMSKLMWDEALCARIAATGHRVVRFDHRDTGTSTHRPPGRPGYALRDLVGDALAVLDAVGARRAHVVGLSMGAAITQLLALEHPERVLTATMLCGTPGGPGHDAPDLPPMSAELAALFDGGTPEPDWSDRAAVARYLVDAERPFSPHFDEEGWRARVGADVDRAPDVAAMASGANHFLLDPGPPWRHRLGGITAPVLVLHGDGDPLLPLAHGEALARETGGRLVVLEGVGHEPPPSRTWDVLVAALESHLGAAREARS